MKVSAQSIPPAVPASERAWLGMILELTKARLTALVLLTTLAGFYLATDGPVDYLLMLHTLAGTGLVAAGAAALNQLLERDLDARMARTRNRPLPSGRMQPETVLLLGGFCSGLGLIYLAVGVNLLTSLLGAITLVLYLFVYTPLKRLTTFNTVVGAIPGALPPLMGWTAARGEISMAGWALFAILFFWQLPHFLAIAWLYKDEYAKAGFMMLPVIDPAGERTGSQTFSHTLGLLPVSLAPFLFQITGIFYVGGALLLGLAFLWFARQFALHLTELHARRLFYFSIIYLPLLFGVMVLDKLK